MMRMARQIWKQTKSCLERLKCLTVSLIYWKEPAHVESEFFAAPKFAGAKNDRHVQSIGGIIALHLV